MKLTISVNNFYFFLSLWIQLLFPSGILVSLSLSGPQVEQVLIDRTLMGKFISNTITDGNYTYMHAVQLPAFRS